MISKEEQKYLNRKLLDFCKYSDSLPIVKKLLDQGADIETISTPDKNTPLLMSAAYGNLEIAKYLIDRGANKEARDFNNSTALHLVAQNGRLDFVKYLVEDAKSDVEANNKWNQTPLRKAAFHGQLEVVKYLFLDRNALMSIFVMFKHPELMKEKMGRETEAQSLFDYFLQNKSKYKHAEIQEFKEKFLELKMNEEDSRNLKPIVKFL